jgi:putative radical SAM enzyme (TIGR03279 family)
MTTKNELAYAGIIKSVSPGSLASRLKLRAGDELLSINDQPLRDVIDVQFYGAEEHLELLIRRDGKLLSLETGRDYNESLGIEFTHPTFDVDIRRCNNLCEFCFVLQTPARMRRTLYIKDDDYRYSFLQGHFVTLTNLSEADWSRIEQQHLSPLYVSVHATELELRRKLLRNPDAPDVVTQLRWLGDRGITVHTQIVVTPELNDGPHLDRSVADLASLWPAVRSVSIVPVGITKHHKYGRRPNTLAEAEIVFDQVKTWQEVLLGEIGVRFAYLTDEWYLVLERPVPSAEEYDGLSLQENGLGMVRQFLDEWRLTCSELARGEWSALNNSNEGKTVTLATGTLFSPMLESIATEFSERTGVPLEIVPVVNERLGETITVAGLLMGRDVINQLQDRNLGAVVILPRIMFDHPDGISLDDVSPNEIARELDRPVVLADDMGDVLDVLMGSAP